MTISIGNSLRNLPFPAGYSGPSRADQASGAPEDANLNRAIEALKEAAAKTPAERAREQVLEKHGLDDQRYAALEADARKTIDDEIAAAVKRATGADQAETTFIRMG